LKAKSTFLWFATAMLTLSVAMAESPLALKQFQHTAWSSKDGAPTEITSLAQTSDGTLWIGTTTGLVRFDGIEFRAWEPRPDGPTMRSRNISTLTAEANGDLWIGYRFGGISLLKDGRLTNYSERDGLPAGDIQEIARDPKHTVWAIAGNRLMHLEGIRWIDRSASVSSLNVRQPVQHFLFDRDGCLWAAVLDHIVVKQTEEQHCVTVKHFVGYATGLVQAPSGEIWLSDYWRPPSAIAHTAAARPLKTQSPPHAGSNAILFASDKALWIATVKHGIERLPFGGKTTPRSIEIFGERDGLTSPETSALLEDREGNIWVGTSRGLDHFSVPKFVTPQGAALHGPPALASRTEGGVWVADPYFKLHFSQQGRMKTSPFGAGVYALATGTGGVLWGAAPKSVLRFQHGRTTRYSVPPSLADLVVQAMVEDADGDLIVSFTYSGVWRLSHGAWSRGITVPGLPDTTPLSMMADSHGRIWFGYVDGSARLSDGNKVVFVPIYADLGQILAFYQDGDRVWIGGSNGVGFFDNGSFHRATLSDPSGFKGISGIVRSRDGDMWFNGANGVVRVPAKDIDNATRDPAYRMASELFDYHDGIDGHAPQLRPMPSAVSDEEGRIWFATSGGALVIDPEHLPRNTVPPMVSIRDVTVEGTRLEAASHLTLSMRPHKVQIAYIGIDLSSPDHTRYRYKLEPEDSDWQDGGTERVASYTNLAPGEYRFLVSARNSDGVWSKSPAVSTFTIPPALIQTRAFLASCLLAFVAVLTLAYALRVRYITLRLQDRMRERVTERLRIARDLHDTLLQGMQGLIMRLHFTAGQMPEREPSRQLLLSALDRADEVLEESRNRVLELRTEGNVHGGLSEALLRLAAQLRVDSEVAFIFLAHGEPRDISALVAEEVAFIFRESMTNALKHSGATKTVAELRYGPEELHLSFSDDGVGQQIDPIISHSDMGHWGIQGMRERAARIDARLDIITSPGAGTTVELRVPRRSAYLPDRLTSRWKLALRVMLPVRLTGTPSSVRSSREDAIDLR
jgi:signal transduction histidine kinase/ligand-binding sensor domain-containing protein